MSLLGKNPRSAWFKIFIILLIVTLLCVIIYFDNRDQWTESYLVWVEENPVLGGISYILVFTAVTILFIPGAILSVLCGYAYSKTYCVFTGVLVGSLLVFLGATLGSIASFLIGRYLFESWVKIWVEDYGKFAALQRVTQVKGLRLMFLLRLSPIIPFNIINYALGLTAVTLRDYTIACFGMVPGSVAFVFLGSSITTISEASDVGIGSNLGILIFAIVGTLLAFIGLVWASAAVRREILTELEKAGFEKNWANDHKELVFSEDQAQGL